MTTDEEEYAKKLGSYIRKLREEKGLSQECLAKETGSTRSHISKIENGKVKLYGHTFDQIFRVLGKTLEEVTLELDKWVKNKFDNEFYELWDLSSGDIKIFEVGLKKLKNNEIYDKNTVYYKQAVALCDAIILRKNEEYKKALDIAYEALDISKPILTKCDKNKRGREINFKYIEVTPLGNVEYKLLICIAHSKRLLKLLPEAIEIFESCKKSLELEEVSLETRHRIQSTVFHSLSNLLINEKRYEYAIAIAKEGKELCEKMKIYDNLGEITYNIAAAYLYLGNTEVGMEYIKESREIFLIHKDIDKANMVYGFLKEKFGIELH